MMNYLTLSLIFVVSAAAPIQYLRALSPSYEESIKNACMAEDTTSTETTKVLTPTEIEGSAPILLPINENLLIPMSNIHKGGSSMYIVGPRIGDPTILSGYTVMNNQNEVVICTPLAIGETSVELTFQDGTTKTLTVDVTEASSGDIE